MKKGFSIIEILVVLGVFAVVSALGLVGLSILQKSSRDSERKNALGEMASKINDYKRSYLSYPPAESIEFSSTEFKINLVKAVDLKGSTRAADSTSTSGTKYYYDRTSAGFILCAKLESGKVESVGTVKDGCIGNL